MKYLKLAAVALVMGALATPVLAKTTTIHVKLWDKDGANMDMSKGMGLGLGMGGDMTKAPMGIDIDKKKVRAGKVTFEVTNTSKGMVHEVIVSSITDPNETMPYLNNENRVDEEHGSHLGEVAELEPGKSGALTVTLKPGLYLLYCNIPQHFVDGMWTILEVSK